MNDWEKCVLKVTGKKCVLKVTVKIMCTKGDWEIQEYWRWLGKLSVLKVTGEKSVPRGIGNPLQLITKVPNKCIMIIKKDKVKIIQWQILKIWEKYQNWKILIVRTKMSNVDNLKIMKIVKWQFENYKTISILKLSKLYPNYYLDIIWISKLSSVYIHCIQCIACMQCS